VSYAAVGIDQINAVGPAGICLLGGVFELIQNSGKLNSEFAYASAGDLGALVFILRAGKDNIVFNVAFHLPHVAGMRFYDIHRQESHAVAVLLVKLIEGGNLPPERRSSIAAEDEHDRLLGQQIRQLHLPGFVELLQREIRSRVTHLKCSGTRAQPHGLERKR
jgi:hypothetical protein